jgi:nickel-dependent lactate racemase
LFTRDLRRALDDLERGMALAGSAQRRGPGPVLILPPDLTRIHSKAGLLTGAACRELEERRNWSLGAIMPALGTHRPLGPDETAFMFPLCPVEKFLPHRWREDAVELGRIGAEWVEAAFGPVRYRGDFPVQVNRLLLSPSFSLVISIGQVAPHEIAGMANHTKNIFIGTGGAEAINVSHYLGALYGLERLMGRRENPVRALFDEAFARCGGLLPPVFWVLSVVDQQGAARGLFTGFGRDCFERAADLSAQVNITRLDEPARTVVVRLPAGYRSLWLGNKAIYRTRMALAGGGELVVLGPCIERFGEDGENDALIRRCGYRGTGAVLRAVDSGELSSLSAAAHLIHGSSEGRFTIRYCTPGRNREFLDRSDIEGTGYEWEDLDAALKRYGLSLNSPEKPGWRTAPGGERFYFVPNPALGLWTAG